MKVMILEDDLVNQRLLQRLIQHTTEEIEIFLADSIEHAREKIAVKENEFEAFFLDINLIKDDAQDQSGFLFAKEIRSQKRYLFTPIIMITSIANLELQAYRELHCYQYMIKPFEESDVRLVIKKLLSQTKQSNEQVIHVKKDGINYKIACKDIVAIRAIPRGVNIVLPKEEMKVNYLSLKQILEKLPDDQFMQCHRMNIVNLDYIDYVDYVNGMIHMTTGENVEIGVTHKNAVKERLNG